MQGSLSRPTTTHGGMSATPFQATLLGSFKYTQWYWFRTKNLQNDSFEIAFISAIKETCYIPYGPGLFLTKNYASQFDHHLCGRLSGEELLASPPNQIHILRMNNRSVKNIQQNVPRALKANSKERCQRYLEQQQHYWKMCAALKVNSYIILHKL